jgi:hypothetical protein
MRVAVTSPLLSVLPCATAHWPTFADAPVPGTVVVYFVADVVVMVRGVVVELEADELRETAAMTIVDPVNDVTFPDAKPPKPPKPPARLPLVPLGALDGRVYPDGAPDGRTPARVPRPPAPVHEPFVAVLMRTVAAVSGADVEADVLEVPLEVVADVATTQLPTVTAERVVDFVTVNFVDAV